MRNQIQPRYDEKRGVYRDCKWCGGSGCLSCPAEAEKEYNRQFPDGPKPICTITTEQMENPEILNALKALISPDAIMAAKEQGAKKAMELFKQFPGLVEMPDGMTEKEAAHIAGIGMAGQIIEENFEKSELKKLLSK